MVVACAVGLFAIDFDGVEVFGCGILRVAVAVCKRL
jgi:hypothetical protein